MAVVRSSIWFQSHVWGLIKFISVHARTVLQNSRETAVKELQLGFCLRQQSAVITRMIIFYNIWMELNFRLVLLKITATFCELPISSTNYPSQYIIILPIHVITPPHSFCLKAECLRSDRAPQGALGKTCGIADFDEYSKDCEWFAFRKVK